MPLSHTCASCGAELCRIRALPDPVYGLPIVVCPRCGTACVRRRHPVPARWREAVRVFASLRWLGMQVVLLALLVVVFAVYVHSLRQDYTGFKPALSEWLSKRDAESSRWLVRSFWREGTVWSVAGWLMFATGIGVWLTAGLAHWRWWCALLAWLALELCAVSVGPAVNTVMDWAGRSAVTRDLPGLQRGARALVELYAIVLLTIPLAVPGMVMGLGARWAGRGLRRVRFKRQLAARRRWRNR